MLRKPAYSCLQNVITNRGRQIPVEKNMRTLILIFFTFILTSCGLTRRDLLKKEYVWTKYKVKETNYRKGRLSFNERELIDTLSNKLAFIIKTGDRRVSGCIIDYRYVYNMKVLSDSTYRIVTMDKHYRTKLKFYEKGKLKKTETLKVGAGDDYLGIEH
jgi:hypothetical protein